MYGPVRTVVWEGSSRKARPYPDQIAGQLLLRASVTGRVFSWLMK